MKKSIFLATAILISVLCQGQAKGTSLFDFNWGPGSTIGHSFVKGFATSGGDIGYSVFIKKNLALGLDLGWNNYWQYKPTATYQFKTGAATTDLYQYLFTLPVTATVTKYFHPGKVFSPYLKGGIGAEYSEQNLYYNIFQTTHSNWGFVANHEVGVRIQPSPPSQFAFNLGFRYLYASNKTSRYNIDNQQAYNVIIGASWTF
jgi:outer membrane protein